LEFTFLNIEWNQDENILLAVEDKLGLKFESQKAPVEVITIDQIDHAIGKLRVANVE
jgi:uncharacterized protein (TIGR03435 family)